VQTLVDLFLNLTTRASFDDASMDLSVVFKGRSMRTLNLRNVAVGLTLLVPCTVNIASAQGIAGVGVSQSFVAGAYGGIAASTLNSAAQSYNVTPSHGESLAVAPSYGAGLTQLNSAAISPSVPMGTAVQGFSVPHFQGYAAEQPQSAGYANAAVGPAIANEAVNAVGGVPPIGSSASFQIGTFNSVLPENRGAVNEEVQPANGFASTAPLNSGNNVGYSGLSGSISTVPRASGGASPNGGNDDGGKSTNKGELPPAPTMSVLSETSMHFSAPLQQAAASPSSDQAAHGVTSQTMQRSLAGAQGSLEPSNNCVLVVPATGNKTRGSQAKGKKSQPCEIIQEGELPSAVAN
jgi:hypothetical protein